jgi:hypothetical protein
MRVLIESQLFRRVIKALGLGVSLLAVSVIAQAADPSLLFLKLASRFESPSVRLLLEESGLARSVLGREARTTEDYTELARVLTLDETQAAGRALEARIESRASLFERLDDLERAGGAFSTSAHLRARLAIEELAESRTFRFLPEEFGVTHARVYSRMREDFLRGTDLPHGVPLSELSAASPVVASEARELVSSITRPLSQMEFAEELSFLAKQFNTTEAEILTRIEANRTTMRELVERARGIRPERGVSSLRAAVLERIRAGIADRRIANPAFERFVATMLATEIVVTVVSEYTARGDQFWNELDYFTADLITFSLAEIVLIWVTHGRATSALSLRGSTPRASTVFDPGFGAGERAMALVRSGVLLGGTGLGIGFVGNGVVEAGKAIRERNDPHAPTASERFQRVLWNAALTGTFMGVSSNLRYQALSRLATVIQNRLTTNRLVQSAILMGLSYGNSFIGGTTYVFYADLATPAVQESLNQMGFEVRLRE